MRCGAVRCGALRCGAVRHCHADGINSIEILYKDGHGRSRTLGERRVDDGWAMYGRWLDAQPKFEDTGKIVNATVKQRERDSHGHASKS